LYKIYRSDVYKDIDVNGSFDSLYLSNVAIQSSDIISRRFEIWRCALCVCQTVSFIAVQL